MSSQLLPEGWTQFLSRKFNRVYYYHAATNRSVWIHPSLLQEDEGYTVDDIGNGFKINTKNNNKECILNIKSKNGSIETLSSPSTLSEKELQKLANENKSLRSRTEEIANWAAGVTESCSSSISSQILDEKNVTNMKQKSSKPTLKPLKSRQRKEIEAGITTKLKNGSIATEYEKTVVDQKKKSRKKNNTKKIKTGLRNTVAEGDKQIFLTPAMRDVINKNNKNKKAKSIKDDDSVVSLSKIRYQPYRNSEKVAAKKDLEIAVPTRNHTNAKIESDVIKNMLSKSSKELPSLKPLDTSKRIPRKRKDSESTHRSARSVQSNRSTKSNSKNTEEKKVSNPFFDKKLDSNRFQKSSVVTPLFSPTLPLSTHTSQVTQVKETSEETKQCESMHVDTEIMLQSVAVDNTQQIETYNLFANYITTNVEEGMDVDDAAELSKEIMREIRGIREENVVTKPQVQAENATELPAYSDPLYIVIDTNILLAHLKFVSELKDYPLPGVGAPILIIPWMVLQELDSLKDAVKRMHSHRNKDGITEKSYELNVLARQAIKFIGTCLEQEHPRLKGESAIEAGTPISGFIEESNDDSILHCGLGLKARANHSHVVLLSNDKNLCNKAIVVGMKAFSQQNVLLGIRSLFQNGTIAVRKENFDEYNKEYKIQAEISKQRKQADDLFCELQCVLREGFSKIIEAEMQAAYDDMWLQIVKIQPPWTLHDVFTLLDKHWIAVFGMVVKRNLHKTINSLKELFWSSEGNPGQLETIENMLRLSLEIFEGFAVHSSYDEMATNCIAGTRVLLVKCQEFLKEAVKQLQLPTTTQIPALLSNAPQAQVPVVDKQPSTEHEKVMDTFKAIWKTVTHYSALIFDSLNYPSPLIKQLDPIETRPTRDEALACLSTMAPCLSNLIRMIQSSLMVPVQNLHLSSQPTSNLLKSIYAFVNQVMKSECAVKQDELLQFCQDQRTRATLVQGLSQLDRSFAMLQQCAELEYYRT